MTTTCSICESTIDTRGPWCADEDHNPVCLACAADASPYSESAYPGDTEG